MPIQRIVAWTRGWKGGTARTLCSVVAIGVGRATGNLSRLARCPESGEHGFPAEKDQQGAGTELTNKVSARRGD